MIRGHAACQYAAQPYAAGGCKQGMNGKTDDTCMTAAWAMMIGDCLNLTDASKSCCKGAEHGASLLILPFNLSEMVAFFHFPGWIIMLIWWLLCQCHLYSCIQISKMAFLYDQACKR